MKKEEELEKPEEKKKGQKLEEGVWLKRTKTSWLVYYPLKKEDGSIDWKNVFGLRNIGGNLLTFAFLMLIIFSAWAYIHDVGVYKDIVAEPWKYYSFCYNPHGQFNLTSQVWNVTGINLPDEIERC